MRHRHSRRKPSVPADGRHAGASQNALAGGRFWLDRKGRNDTHRRCRDLPVVECAPVLCRWTRIMRRNFLKFFAIAAALALVACPPKNEGGGGNAAAGGGDILIGEYGSLTGPQATFGTSTHNAIMMAIDEINAASGVNGRKIKVLTEDDQSKQEEAANAVTKLISQNGVLAVLGEVASSCSLAAAPICQSNKVPMITPSSTNPSVTQKGDYIFRVCFTDDYQGENIAKYAATQLHIKRAAILTDVKNDYSTGLTTTLTRVFTSLGGQ